MNGAAGGRPPDPRAALGQLGERLAARHLQERGIAILARRWRRRLGEIDLVADDRGTLVFVEVKTRSGEAFGRPADAVGARKQARLARLAECFLAEHGFHDRLCRFDVVEVDAADPGRARVRHIPDAFRPPAPR